MKINEENEKPITEFDEEKFFMDAIKPKIYEIMDLCKDHKIQFLMNFIFKQNDDSHDSGLFMNVKYNNSSAIKKMQLCGALLDDDEERKKSALIMLILMHLIN